MKMKTSYLVMGLLLTLGLLFRLSNLDLPPIGAHNAKEIDYLSPAQFYLQHGFDLERHAHVLNEDGLTAQEEYPQLPLLSGAIALIWKFFGEHLWSARLLIILLSLLGLPAMYWLSKSLLGGELEATIATALFSILPVIIFYGRNIQP
jgi:hypothetical protein